MSQTDTLQRILCAQEDRTLPADELREALEAEGFSKSQVSATMACAKRDGLTERENAKRDCSVKWIGPDPEEPPASNQFVIPMPPKGQTLTIDLRIELSDKGVYITKCKR